MSSGAAQAITLRQLRAFAAVARERSFTRAAEILHLTQPALTSCIRQLEDRVGSSLLDRTTRQVRVNRFGEALLPRIERLLNELDLGLEEVRSLREGSSGVIALATLPSIASSIMPQSVARYSQLLPGVGITMAEDHSEGVRRRVLEGEADFGLSGIVTEAFPDVVAEPLFYDTIGLFCHADHRLTRLERPVKWADLAGEEIFNMGYQTQIQEILDVVPELAISLSQTAYRVRNPLTTLSMIRSQRGIAALPRLSIPADALTDVVFRPLTGPELRREIFLCRRTGSMLTTAAQALIGEIVQSAVLAGAMLL